jgi:hypothetical protein
MIPPISKSADPIYAILEFDEAKGLFSWYGTFGIEWMDDFIKWNTSANDDLLTLK